MVGTRRLRHVKALDDSILHCFSSTTSTRIQAIGATFDYESDCF